MTRASALLLAALLAAGCNPNTQSSPGSGSAPTVTATATTAKPSKTEGADADEAEIKANLAKLSPEDRALAEKQKYCVIESENRLGSMGVPIKVTVKGEPVFICCKGCKGDVEKDPDGTLKKVKELREKNAKK